MGFLKLYKVRDDSLVLYLEEDGKPVLDPRKISIMKTSGNVFSFETGNDYRIVKYYNLAISTEASPEDYDERIAGMSREDAIRLKQIVDGKINRRMSGGLERTTQNA